MATKKNNVRVVIIEDEPHNSTMLEAMVAELRPGWTVEAVLESVAESVGWLKENKAPDLVLADIQLSDGLSFSIFKIFDPGVATRIIFTTAYDEYAIRAFQVNSIDYLLKPLKRDDLEKAFVKYENILFENPSFRQYNQDDREYFSSIIDSIIGGRKAYRSRFLISGINSYNRLDTKDIAYIYSENKVTFAVDKSSKEYTLNYSLEQLENELDPEQFFRANRKIIVSIDSVSHVRNERDGKLSLQTDPKAGFDIGISRIKAADFKNWLGG